jgi:hypothetical protein
LRRSARQACERSTRFHRAQTHEAIQRHEARIGGHDIGRCFAADDVRGGGKRHQPMFDGLAVLVRRRPIGRQPQVVRVDRLVLDAVALLAEDGELRGARACLAVAEGIPASSHDSLTTVSAIVVPAAMPPPTRLSSIPGSIALVALRRASHMRIASGARTNPLTVRGVRVDSEVTRRRALDLEQRGCLEIGAYRVALVAPRAEQPSAASVPRDVRHGGVARAVRSHAISSTSPCRRIASKRPAFARGLA